QAAEDAGARVLGAVPAGADGEGPALLPRAGAAGRPAGPDCVAGAQRVPGCTPGRIRPVRHERAGRAHRRRDAAAGPVAYFWTASIWISSRTSSGMPLSMPQLMPHR